MSIVGIDIGNLYTKAATLENGVVNSLLFNNSNRLNNTSITFKEKRLIGSDSFNIYRNNNNNSVNLFNSLIHSLFSNNNFNQTFYNKNEDDNDFMPVKLIDDNEYHLHFVYMSYLDLLLKSINKLDIESLVLSIPSYFNVCDVKFVEDSLYLLNKNYKLISEEYATALDYGFYKSFKGEFNVEKNVLFVNIGDYHTNIYIVSFNNEGIKLIKSNSILIGGNDYTTIIYDFLKGLIYKEFEKNVDDYPKKKYSVFRESEKAKKVLSTNNKVNINLDCIFDDTSFNYTLDREKFDRLTQNLTLEIINTLNEVLSNLDLSDIDSIELLGGSMRIKNIKQMIKKRVDKELNFTLNAEDSVARGCVIYGAINSPIIKNAKYKIEKFIEEPIYLKMENFSNDTKVIENLIKIPHHTKITCNIKNDLTVTFYQGNNHILSLYQIKTDKKIKEKLKIDLHIEYNQMNQIEIKNYEIYNNDNNHTLEIIQTYQAKLTKDDLKELKSLKNTTEENEETIDKFYDVINYLEDKYYNKFQVDFLDSDEKNCYYDILKNINEDILEENPEKSKIDNFISYKKQLDEIKYLVETREYSCLNFDKFKKKILQKFDSYYKTPTQDLDNFKVWLDNKLSLKIEKYQYHQLENEIFFEFDKITKSINQTE